MHCPTSDERFRSPAVTAWDRPAALSPLGFRFAIGVTGYTDNMAESKNSTNSTPQTSTSRSAKRAVSNGAKAPARDAKASASSSAAAVKDATAASTTAAREAKDATRSAAQGGKEALAGFGGAVADTARTVQRTVGSAAGRAGAKAGIAWTLVKARKAVAAGAGAGVATAVASSYALGRRAGLRQRGPLSRLTGGRL